MTAESNPSSLKGSKPVTITESRPRPGRFERRPPSRIWPDGLADVQTRGPRDGPLRITSKSPGTHRSRLAVPWLRNDVFVRRRWGWGWSWRLPSGWRLLGWVLVVGCVALPVWALTGGDLNQAARWAPLVALPLTALGLALVPADRDRGQAATEVMDAQRRPWMAPPLNRMVERPELGDPLVATLMAPFPGEVGLTTGLAGAGGDALGDLGMPPTGDRAALPGWPLWTTVGQEVGGTDLAERVKDLAFATAAGAAPG
jgi:hypothetical protein